MSQTHEKTAAVGRKTPVYSPAGETTVSGEELVKEVKVGKYTDFVEYKCPKCSKTLLSFYESSVSRQLYSIHSCEHYTVYKVGNLYYFTHLSEYNPVIVRYFGSDVVIIEKVSKK